MLTFHQSESCAAVLLYGPNQSSSGPRCYYGIRRVIFTMYLLYESRRFLKINMMDQLHKDLGLAEETEILKVIRPLIRY